MIDTISDLNYPDHEYFALLGISQLNQHFSSNCNVLRMFSVNSQSFNSIQKLEQLELLLSTGKVNFDIISICETWHNFSSEVHRIPGYACHSVIRERNKGGGISIYIREDVSYSVLSEFSVVSDDYESAAIILNNILYLAVYRLPHVTNIATFYDFLHTALEWAAHNRLQIIISGDFNIDFLIASAKKRQICDLFSSFSCHNLIHAATRLTSNSSKLLDPIFSNLQCSAKTAVLTDSFADHLPVVAEFSIGVIRNAEAKRFTRQFNQESIALFRSLIGQSNFNSIYHLTNPNEAYDMFIQQYLACYNQAFPLREVHRRGRIRKPYITPEIFSRLKVQHSLYAKFIRTRKLSDLAEFKKFRNKVNNDIKKNKKRYVNQLFPEHLNSKTLWQRVGIFANYKMKQTGPERIVHGQQVLTDHDMSSSFNQYFTNITSNLHIDTTVPNFCFDAVENRSMGVFALTTGDSVVKYINQLRGSCAAGSDDILPISIKFVKQQISSVLAHLINISLISGIFPDALKMAKVTVIYKKGDKTSLGNYRPISLLPAFSKIYERVIYDQICSFIRPALSSSQFGFLSHSSTEMALLKLKDSILGKLNNVSTKILAIIIDFCKAFDCCNHETLLYKLHFYGVKNSCLKLMTSYLENRRQFVKIQEHASPPLPIIQGVPQGSILGPLLFLIYINDLTSCLADDGVNLIQFADDSTIMCNALNYDELSLIANRSLEKLNQWCSHNKMKVNAAKTHVLPFAKNSHAISKPNIIYNKELLSYVTTAKILGVTFDSRLTFKDHVQEIRKTLAWKIGLLFRVRHILPTKIKLRLYFAHIHSHMYYCHLVWGTAAASVLEPLIILQKRAVRIICNAPYLCHTQPLFRHLKILQLQNFYKYKLVMTIRQNNPRLTAMFNLQNRDHSYDMRHPSPFTVAHTRMRSTDNILSVRVANVLNELYQCNTDIYSLSFGQLKRLLIHQQFQ